MEGREDRWGRGITLSCLLDPWCCNQWCLLYFSTVLPYLLLKQSDESFMHRKLKNIAHQYMMMEAMKKATGKEWGAIKETKKSNVLVKKKIKKKERKRNHGNRSEETFGLRKGCRLKGDTASVSLCEKSDNSTGRRKKWKTPCCCGLDNTYLENNGETVRLYSACLTIRNSRYEPNCTLCHIWTRASGSMWETLDFTRLVIFVNFSLPHLAKCIENHRDSGNGIVRHFWITLLRVLRQSQTS